MAADQAQLDTRQITICSNSNIKHQNRNSFPWKPNSKSWIVNWPRWKEQISNIMRALSEGFGQASLTRKMAELENWKAKIEALLTKKEIRLRYEPITEDDLRHLLSTFRQYILPIFPKPFHFGDSKSPSLLPLPWVLIQIVLYTAPQLSSTSLHPMDFPGIPDNR